MPGLKNIFEKVGGAIGKGKNVAVGQAANIKKGGLAGLDHMLWSAQTSSITKSALPWAIAAYGGMQAVSLYQSVASPTVKERWAHARQGSSRPDYSSITGEQVFQYARGSVAPRLGTTGGQVLGAHNRRHGG